MSHTLLIGAEGVAERAGTPWLREANEDEKETFCAFYGAKLRELNVDGTGRPYWLMTITDDAPEGVLKANAGYGRLVRLREALNEREGMEPLGSAVGESSRS